MDRVLSETGTPVGEIPTGARFDHWLYGPVTVLRKYDVTDNRDRPLVRLGLMASVGEIADDWRPDAQIHLMEG